MISGGPLLTLRDVGKRYQVLSEPPSLSRQWLPRLLRLRHAETVWAVRHADLVLEPGEGVMVLGPNGSGKSTLLRLAAGIVRPTEGRVESRGRIAPMLDLTAGFRPELSGRENILISANLMGLLGADLRRRLPAIEDFTGLGPALGRPVRTYSSGMILRLGFATAIHADHDVLVVDEVLTVGDAEFKEKCMDRMHALLERGGALLNATHDPDSSGEVCARAVHMDAGVPVAAGETGAVAGLWSAGPAPVERAASVLERRRARVRLAVTGARDGWSRPDRNPRMLTVYDARAIERVERRAGSLAAWLDGLNVDLTTCPCVPPIAEDAAGRCTDPASAADALRDPADPMAADAALAHREELGERAVLLEGWGLHELMVHVAGAERAAAWLERPAGDVEDLVARLRDWMVRAFAAVLDAAGPGEWDGVLVSDDTDGTFFEALSDRAWSGQVLPADGAILDGVSRGAGDGGLVALHSHGWQRDPAGVRDTIAPDIIHPAPTGDAAHRTPAETCTLARPAAVAGGLDHRVLADGPDAAASAARRAAAGLPARGWVFATDHALDARVSVEAMEAAYRALDDEESGP